MTKDELKEVIARVKRNVRVTKVVATRAIKTKRGDFFAGFSAAWNTVQDDAGGMGADQDVVMETAEIAMSGMTLQESKVAHNIVAMQADVAAYEAAFANGGISRRDKDEAIKAIKNNYARLIKDALLTDD
jgi:hypothetical protein